MQHFLDEVLQLCSFSLVLSDMVLNFGMMRSLAENMLAAGVVSIEWRQVPSRASLETHKCKHVTYHVI
jgi:hypothetical protein